jgi:transposase-like protein
MSLAGSSRRSCAVLVMIGVRSDGRKELVALSDGYRESSESWADLLRSCRRRGMTAPVLAVGDGALGFWKALREVFPSTREQRCWFHKQANVLAGLPKSAHSGALAALREIYNAEDIDKAQVAIKAFAVDYGAKYPKAVAKITDDADVLLEFYKYPAEHWVHLRTTNPMVIWSSRMSVFDVRHGVAGSRVLLAGRGYLQPSRRQSLRRKSACYTGGFAGLVA